MKFLQMAGWALAASVWAAPAGAVELGPPALVADLSVAPVDAGSSPFPFPQPDPGRELGYFSADDGLHGNELWRTDGTAAGTSLVRDLCPGACGSYPVPVAQVGDRLFFETTRWGENRLRSILWVTDGTWDGTRVLLQGFGSHGVAFRDELWFAHGSALWRSDGSAGGTEPVVELCGVDCPTAPDELTVAGDLLFFTAHDPRLGIELWASDGTAAGTGVVADICPGPCHSQPLELTPFGDRLFFVADDGAHGREPWISDGTAAGTALVVDWAFGVAGSDLDGFVVFDGRVCFVTHPSVPGISPSPPELWCTDATEAGTRPVPPQLPLEALTARLGPVVGGGDRLLMTIWDGQSTSVHAYDRTTGTRRLLASGFRTSGVGSGGRIGDSLLFLASRSEELQGPGSMQLWRTDGTPEGTAVVRSFDLGGAFVQRLSMAPVAGGEAQVFAAPDGLGGHEPWITDGTAGGTRLLEEVRPPRASSDPREVTRHGSWVYFVADGEAGDGALWRAAAAGGRLELVDSSRPWGRLVAAGNRLFAVPADRTALARVDPAAGTLHILAEPRSLVNEPTAVADRLFFGTEGEGQELWVSDGTEEGTRLVIDLDPSWTDGCKLPIECGDDPTVYPADPVAAEGTLYFFAPPPSFRGSLAPALWRSDGTASGTVPLTEERFLVLAAESVGHRLVFSVHADSGGFQLLWTSDGTPEGTGPLRSAEAGPEADLLGWPLAADEGSLFLSVVGDGEVPELWITDGTSAGTRRIAPLGSGGEPVRWATEAVVAAGGRLFFTAEHPVLGEELWTSDGTAGGTGPVTDLVAGPASSRPEGLVPLGAGVLFAAAGDGAGYELWASDGTAEGTRRLTDLHPGPAASGPSWITVTPGALFFAADDGETGRELWRAPILGDPPPPGEAPPPDREPIVSPAFPGFRFWVEIGTGGDRRPGTPVALCLPETVCVAGALPGRTEVLLRMVGPKPNGRLWPTLVKLSTSRVEVWIEQEATGIRRHYVLEGARPGVDELPGLFDRDGFPPL